MNLLVQLGINPCVSELGSACVGFSFRTEFLGVAKRTLVDYGKVMGKRTVNVLADCVGIQKMRRVFEGVAENPVTPVFVPFNRMHIRSIDCRNGIVA